MNKRYIPLAIFAYSIGLASPFTIAQEDPSVDFYGSIRTGVDNVDADTQDDGANGRDFLSRVGFKSQLAISDRLSGFAQVEYGLRSDNLVDIQQNGDPTLRLALVGLQGSWGQISYGSQTLLWHKYVRNSYFSDGLDSVRQGAIRDDDLLQYTHSIGALSFGLGAQFEGQDGDSVDQLQIGGQYTAGPVKLQAAYSSDERGENTGGLLGLRAFWQVTEQFLVSAYTHRADEDYDLYAGSATGNVRLRDASIEGRVNGIPSCVGEERDSTGLYGSYRIGSNLFHARYAVDNCKDAGDVDSIKVEYVRFLNKKYRAWIAYEDLSNDDGRRPTTSSGSDMSELQVGVRFDF